MTRPTRKLLKAAESRKVRVSMLFSSLDTCVQLECLDMFRFICTQCNISYLFMEYLNNM